MAQQNHASKKSAWYRAGRMLRSEALERREVLSAAGWGGVLAAPQDGANGAGAGDCDTVQVAGQGGAAAQQQMRMRPATRSALFGGYQESTPQQKSQQGAGQGSAALLGGDLDSQETADLLHMRQEEKLALDVYRTLGEQHQVAIFDNIANAEQQHLDAMGSLIDKYGLDDPIEGYTMGQFQDPTLQGLYDTLIAQGAESLAQAYQVGITIEELDIVDLQQAITTTDNADLTQAYGNLLAGSENHLAAFTAASEGRNTIGVSCTGSGAGAEGSQSSGQATQSGDRQQTRRQDQLRVDPQQCDQQDSEQQQLQDRDRAFEELGTQQGDPLRTQTQDRVKDLSSDLQQERLRGRR
ncbi:DUF2202 domain-containing protein [Aeoliella sp. ICT_H6.2]|uniref:DUF2202 domain-containing protein n=1 Tax=Aeoliella straminimaris TaxID=2954799 RepID=A0A9X2FGP2_9BACT|nr:DUF2202 domain-containing protein [Aeoliella straminimaris]MCO6048093.1 DUF2202 domain-containing protein [Aeoliella straminimaris]